MITSQYSAKTEQRVLSNLVAGESKVASVTRDSEPLNSALETWVCLFVPLTFSPRQSLAMMLVVRREKTG